ncbi:MAG: hypothetical protein ACRCSP_03470 [Rhodoglobus sp.]
MHSENLVNVDDHRLFPVIDRYFIFFIVFQLLVFPFVPFLPLGVAAVSLATPLRRSRWRIVTLWVLGAILGMIVVAPFVIALLDINIVDEGPVRTVSS